jgi:hypothetical protein
MAIVDLVKSWFRKDNKVKTPTPTTTIAKNPPITTPTPNPKLGNLPKTNESPTQSLTDIVNSTAQFSIREIALSKIDDQSQLADIVVTHSIAKIRQQAAEKLSDLAIIARTAEKIKHSDKGVYRQLRKKLDTANALNKAAQQQQQRLEKICADLETQSRLSLNPLFAAKVQSLQQQWQQATQQAPAHPTVEQRYQHALASVNSIVQQRETQQHAESTAKQKQDEVNKQLEDLLDIIINEKQEVTPLQLKQNLNNINEIWQQATTVLAADKAQVKHVTTLQQQLSSLCHLFEQCHEQLTLLHALTEQLNENPLNQTAFDTLKNLLKPLALTRINPLPPTFVSIQETFQLAEMALAAQKSAQSSEIKSQHPQQEKVQHAEFEQLLQQIEQALNAGNSREASQYLRNAQQFAKKYHLYEPRLNEWSQELQKLKDWAGFAIIPKKEALVASMAELAEASDTDIDGLTRLDEIKALQAEWQAMGMVNNDAERALWQQFKDLSQKAYTPCQRYFDEQNAIQAKNAIQREALCDELQTYLDNMPNDVNWQGHIAILKKAREDWQLHHPVEAKAHKKLQHRFNSIIKALEDKLHAEYALQESRKNTVIQEAIQLLQHEDIREACQQAKNLQQTWKSISSCGHTKDQALWETFRSHCDAVFAKREQLKQSQQAEEAQSLVQAHALLAQFEQLLAQEFSIAHQSTIATIISTFQALYLPREANHNLRAQLSHLRTQWQTKQQAYLDSEKLKQLTLVTHALQLCLDAEHQVLTGSPVSLSQVLTWQALQLPSFFKVALTKRWQSLSSLQMKRADERLTAFNDGCLLLELLLDMEGLDKYQAARTAKKMDMFSQQSYPKTQDEKQALIQQTLTSVLLLSALPTEQAADANLRLVAIIQNPMLSSYL